MSDLESFELDQRGVAYLRERVDHLRGYAPALGEVCVALERVLEKQAGRVTTLAPRGTPLARIYQFEAGGLLPENLDFSRATRLEDGSTMTPIESLRDERHEALADALESAPNRVCLVVDPLPRRGDPSLTYYSTTFCVGDEVYQLVTPETAADDCKLAMYAPPFWCDLNIVSSLAPRIDAARNSTAAQLRQCAEAAVELWCGAYDGEGFLRWRGV